jgi:hypothetical protein
MTPQDVRKTMELIDSLGKQVLPVGDAVELPPDSGWQQWDMAEQLAGPNPLPVSRPYSNPLDWRG